MALNRLSCTIEEEEKKRFLIRKVIYVDRTEIKLKGNSGFLNRSNGFHPFDPVKDGLKGSFLCLFFGGGFLCDGGVTTRRLVHVLWMLRKRLSRANT